MTTAARPRGHYAKTDARRRSILDAAVQVFSSAGFRKGSLRDVAALTGLSQAGLLHHFPTKVSLLMAVLEWRDQDTLSRIGDPPPAGVDMLRALVREVEHNTRVPELVELHVIMSAEASHPDHPAHDYFVRRYEVVRATLQDGFSQASVARQLRPHVDPAAAATVVTALMDGLQIQWLLDRAGVDMAEHLRHHLRALLTVEL